MVVARREEALSMKRLVSRMCGVDRLAFSVGIGPITQVRHRSVVPTLKAAEYSIRYSVKVLNTSTVFSKESKYITTESYVKLVRYLHADKGKREPESS